MKRLVTIVHGFSRKTTRCKPKTSTRLGLIEVAINSKRFIAIRNHTAVNLEPRYAITLPITDILGFRPVHYCI